MRKIEGLAIGCEHAIGPGEIHAATRERHRGERTGRQGFSIEQMDYLNQRITVLQEKKP